MRVSVKDIFVRLFYGKKHNRETKSHCKISEVNATLIDK